MGVLRRLVPNPRTLRGKLGIGAFFTAFLVLVGTTAGYAYWTANASATSTVSAATLSLSTTNFTSVAYTFGNDALTTTGSVTATNTTTSTSTRGDAVSLTFGPGDSGTLAGKVTLNVWATGSAANCTAAATVPAGATSALWSASTSVSTSLAPGASAVYCLRSTIATRESVAVSGGSMTFKPQISGTISVGNFAATSTTATVTQNTQYIYPAYTSQLTNTWNWIRPNPAYNNGVNICMDALAWGTASGTQVIGFTCNNPGSSNQLWQFTASSTPGYYTITPKHAPNLRLDNQASTNPDSVVIATASASTSQLWQLQLVSTGVYEIVNASNGRCLNPATSTGHFSQYPCNGLTTQQFYISPAFNGFTCAVSVANYIWSWTTGSTGPFKVFVTSGGTTTQVASTTGATTLTVSSIAVGAYTTPGSYPVTIVDAYGTTVGNGTFTIGGNPNTCTANALTP